MAHPSVVNGTSPLAGTGALLDANRRELRVAEQAAHAERMRRIELEEELARCNPGQTEADVLRVDLVAARERIDELKREREHLCREVAEAEQRLALLATRAQPPPVTAMGSAPALNGTAPSPSVPAVEQEAIGSIGSIEAGRLAEALSRLREAAPEPSEQTASGADGAAGAAAAAAAAGAGPAAPGAPWLAPVFRAMVRRDPARAGRLVLALLPAQPLVEPLPLAYDLVLLDLGCVRVTAAGGRAVVELGDAARRREQVQLVVRGELSSLARLIATGAVRRRLRPRGLARARGSRSTLNALRALVRAPVSLEQLRAAGVRPSPALSLSLIAAMVQPEWTAGETFTIAHREPDAGVAEHCLRVRDGAPVVAGDLHEAGMGGGADLVRPTTTIVCPAASLLAAFDGAGGSGTFVEGDRRPLAIVQSWVKRAQSA